jgi:hypothetical protein
LECTTDEHTDEELECPTRMGTKGQKEDEAPQPDSFDGEERLGCAPGARPQALIQEEAPFVPTRVPVVRFKFHCIRHPIFLALISLFAETDCPPPPPSVYLCLYDILE